MQIFGDQFTKALKIIFSLNLKKKAMSYFFRLMIFIAYKSVDIVFTITQENTEPRLIR